MGPGFTRMNAVTVQQSTQGLCAYLEETSPGLLKEGGGVLIGAPAVGGRACLLVLVAEGERPLLFCRLAVYVCVCVL